jgi:HK97 family phage major capsid protein
MSDIGEIKGLLDEQGRLWQEFRRKNDELIAAKADGKAVGDLKGVVERIEARLGEIDEQKSSLQTQLDEVIKRANRPQLGATPEGADVKDEHKAFNLHRRALAKAGQQVSDVGVDEYIAYKSAFDKFQRHGEKSLENTEIKALQAGVDSDGGFLLPPPMMGRIVKKVYELAPLRSLFSVVQISGNDIEGIEDLEEASSGGWVTETQARTETSTPKVGRWRIEAHEEYASPKITQRLLDDGAFDAEGWLADKIGNKFARTEAAAFVTGTGVGQPHGFAAYPTAATADGSRAWGTMEHVVTGANGAWHTTQADPMFDLIAAFKPVYLQNASWVTNRQVIAGVRKFKTTTTNEYIWQPGLQLGQPDRILGFNVVLTQDMPTLATGSLSMALGDWREAYTVVDRIGIRTLRDPYTDKPYIVFYSTRRVGGGVLNYEAVKFIRFSAS